MVREARAADIVTLAAAVPALGLGLWQAQAGVGEGAPDRDRGPGLPVVLLRDLCVLGRHQPADAGPHRDPRTRYLVVRARHLWARPGDGRRRNPIRLPRRTAGGFLIVVVVLFALTWLGQIMTAITTGTLPVSVSDLNLPTNAVYALDLAFALPLLAVAGSWLIRRDRRGPAAALAALGFTTLMGLSVLAIFVDRRCGRHCDRSRTSRDLRGRQRDRRRARGPGPCSRPPGRAPDDPDRRGHPGLPEGAVRLTTEQLIYSGRAAASLMIASFEPTITPPGTTGRADRLCSSPFRIVKPPAADERHRARSRRRPSRAGAAAASRRSPVRACAGAGAGALANPVAAARITHGSDADVGAPPGLPLGKQRNHRAVGADPQPDECIQRAASHDVPAAQKAKDRSDRHVLGDHEAIPGEAVVLLDDGDQGRPPSPCWRQRRRRSLAADRAEQTSARTAGG